VPKLFLILLNRDAELPYYIHLQQYTIKTKLYIRLVGHSRAHVPLSTCRMKKKDCSWSPWGRLSLCARLKVKTKKKKKTNTIIYFKCARRLQEFYTRTRWYIFCHGSLYNIFYFYHHALSHYTIACTKQIKWKLFDISASVNYWCFSKNTEAHYVSDGKM